MSKFCFDQYEHPLLWCDEKKRLAERKNAEESTRQWRRMKAEEMTRKEREKQEYHEMFLKHCPWGRPGGGAPNVDVRRRDITASGLHSIPSLNVSHHNRNLSLPPCRYMDLCPLSKPRKHCMPIPSGGGQMTSSGGQMSSAAALDSICVNPTREPKVNTSADTDQLCITLKDHPAMTFRNKGHVDIEVRYKSQPKGKPTLDKIVVTEKDKCPGEEHKEMARRKNEDKDPWGKPGPGGKPWRSPKAIGSSFMKSMGWTNKAMLKELDQDNPVTPAEKFQKSPKKCKSSKKLEKCCALCTCTCPNNRSSPLKPLLKKSSSSRDKKFELQKQKICPRFARQCTINEEGVELVPLLARRRAANRPISLSSTDVTKRTADNSWSKNADLHYLSDLNKQMSQKRRGMTLNKQEDRKLCRKHFETFENFWGRPGHGAPTCTTNKLKLDDLLYGSQSCTE